MFQNVVDEVRVYLVSGNGRTGFLKGFRLLLVLQVLVAVQVLFVKCVWMSLLAVEGFFAWFVLTPWLLVLVARFCQMDGYSLFCHGCNF